MGKKGKGNKYQIKPESSQGREKRDLSKIKCFHCNEYGHYANNCPQKNERKRTLGGAEHEPLASQFKLEFTLIVCISNTVTKSVWYLDSAVSFHMTWCRELLSDLEEKDLRMHIKLGEDGRYNMTGIGTITF